MKKILFLLIIVLFVSGCSIEYNIYFDYDLNYYEEVTFSGNYSDYGVENNNRYDLESEKVEYIKDYNNNLIENYENYEIIENKVNDNTYIFKVKSKEFNITNLNDSDIIKKLYDVSVTQKENGNYLVELTSIFTEELINNEEFEAFEFTNLDIVVNSKTKIINSNADTIDNNKHIWSIDNSNVENIYFEITKTPNIIDYSVYVVILAIILIVVFFFKNKFKKVNEIN